MLRKFEGSRFHLKSLKILVVYVLKDLKFRQGIKTGENLTPISLISFNQCHFCHISKKYLLINLENFEPQIQSHFQKPSKKVDI